MWNSWKLMSDEAKIAATMSITFNSRKVVQGSDAKIKSPQRQRKCKQPEPVNLSTTISSLDTSTEAPASSPKKRQVHNVS